MSLFSRFFGKQPPKEGEEGTDATDAPQTAPTVPPASPSSPAAAVREGAPPQPGAAPGHRRSKPTPMQTTQRMIPADQLPPPPPGLSPSSEPAVPAAAQPAGPAVELGPSAPPPSSVDPRFAHWGGRDPNAIGGETVPPVRKYDAEGASAAQFPPPAEVPAALPTPAEPPVAAAAAQRPEHTASEPSHGAVTKPITPAARAKAAKGAAKRRDGAADAKQVIPSPPQAPHPGLRPNDALPTIIVDIPESIRPPPNPNASAQPTLAGARSPSTPAGKPGANVQKNTLVIPQAAVPKIAVPTFAEVPPAEAPVQTPRSPLPGPVAEAPAPPAPAPVSTAAPKSAVPSQRAMSDTMPDADSQAIMRAAAAYRAAKAAVAAAALPAPGSSPVVQPSPNPLLATPGRAPREKFPTLLGGMSAPKASEPVASEPSPSPSPSPTNERTPSALPRQASVPPLPPVAEKPAPLDEDDSLHDDGPTVIVKPEARSQPELEPKTDLNLGDYAAAALAAVHAATSAEDAPAEPTSDAGPPTAADRSPPASEPPSPPAEDDWPSAAELPDPDAWSEPAPSHEAARTWDDLPKARAEIALDGAAVSEPSPMTTRSEQPPPLVEGAELEVISSGPATIPPSAPVTGMGSEPRLWEFEGMDDVMSELERGFGELGGIQSGPPAGSPVFDDARDLFKEIAAGHMHHVRDFMLDLSGGPATAEWLALCVPATESLQQGAAQFEMAPLADALHGFLVALRAASDAGAPVVEGPHRERLIEAYAALVSELPSAFKLDREGRVREGIIVRALLNQLEDVRKVQQDRLFAAGLMSLDALCSAKPRDIVETTGLSLELAARVSERFRRYRLEMSLMAQGDAREEWQKLREYTAVLTAAHAAFEDADQKRDSKKKKESRRARELALLDVKVMLARLGKPDSLNLVERVPFAEKIAHLTALTP